MIVAMVAMRMMEMTFHQVVRMAAVRNRFVPATGAMLMRFLVRPAIVIRGARRWVFRIHGDLVLVKMTAVRVV